MSSVASKLAGASPEKCIETIQLLSGVSKTAATCIHANLMSTNPQLLEHFQNIKQCFRYFQHLESQKYSDLPSRVHDIVTVLGPLTMKDLQESYVQATNSRYNMVKRFVAVPIIWVAHFDSHAPLPITTFKVLQARMKASPAALLSLRNLRRALEAVNYLDESEQELESNLAALYYRELFILNCLDLICRTSYKNVLNKWESLIQDGAEYQYTDCITKAEVTKLANTIPGSITVRDFTKSIYKMDLWLLYCLNI